MKLSKSFLLSILTTVTTGNSSRTDGADKNLAAIGVLYAAHGKASQFLYDELWSKPIGIGGRSGVAKPSEVTQDRLANRLLDLQRRHEKVIEKCGPGVEKQKSAIILDGRAGGWNTYTPSFGMDPFDSDRISGLSGQTAADKLGQGLGGFDLGASGAFGGRFQSSSNFDIFSPSGAIPGVGSFDPLGAQDFGGSFRRRRFVTDKPLTKNELKKKLKRMTEAFEPMDTFLNTQLENCSVARVDRLKAKVLNAKDRVEKVIRRQGARILEKQKKERRAKANE